MEKINVLSCYDGMSCGQIALNLEGIQVDKYHACEIDPYAIKITQKNYPNTIQLGDIKKVSGKDLPKIDLLMGGSPCQSFSRASTNPKGFDDDRGQLFFEFVRLLKELKPKYFLLENVRMKQEDQDIISMNLGIKPILINSALVSAQSRNRLYWTNIPNVTQPKDKGIVLKDILEDLPFPKDTPNYLNNTWGGKTRGERVKSINDAKANCLTANMWKGQIPTYVKTPIQVGVASNIRGYDAIKRVYSDEGKSPTLTTCGGGHREPKVASKDEVYYRKITPRECERLQTVPQGYTEGVSNTQRYKMLGNGWTVDVIRHILRGAK